MSHQRRLWILAVLVCAGLAPARGSAQAARDFGLGIIIGAPTGVSGKGFLSPEYAIDGAVGFGLIGGDHLRIHADFLWHLPIKQWPSAALDLYLGVGPALGFRGDRGPAGRTGRDDNDLRIGARAPFGLAVMFDPAPFDVFLEVAAGLWLVTKVDLHLDAAIGGRYWF